MAWLGGGVLTMRKSMKYFTDCIMGSKEGMWFGLCSGSSDIDLSLLEFGYDLNPFAIIGKVVDSLVVSTLGI